MQRTSVSPDDSDNVLADDMTTGSYSMGERKKCH